MEKTEYRFVTEILKDGVRLHQAPVPLHAFESAVEWAQFHGVRRGKLPSFLGGSPSTCIEPHWDREAGAPYVEGFRVRVEEDGGDALSPPIPITYFSERAQLLAESLFEEGKLAKGERFTYRVCALAGAEGAPQGVALTAAMTGSDRTSSEPFACEDLPQELQLAERDLDTFLERAERVEPEGGPASDALPVFMPRHLLLEAEALKEKAGDVETGAVIIGHLRRDSRRPEVFAEVTALLPAPYTEATSTRVTFTADSWQATEAVLQLRGAGEVMLGFLHTHPARFWCSKCESSRWATCPMAQPFFSTEDRAFHKDVFPRAFSIAVVSGDTFDAEQGWKVFHALYGWHEGIMTERGYHVLLDP